MKTAVSARIDLTVVGKAKARGEAEGVSLSAIIERALAEYVAQPMPGSEAVAEKPAWAIALEERVSQLEAQQHSSPRGRKGKRRR